MPAAIPDRYDLEIRLGRDGDIEEWLANDTSLQRPVLVRSLGPESTTQRRQQFVSAVGAAAKTAHSHLAKVFIVEEVAAGAYSVSEWVGGASLADRVQAGAPMALEEFLPNASGLAGALAELHETAATHGDVDLSAISYSVAHPAKLGAFGRPLRTDHHGDVRALAAVLETAVTGMAPGGPPPSETIDGFPRAIDRILRSAQSGNLSARELEKALLAAPTPRVPQPEPRSASRRLLFAAGALVVVAVGLVALGRLFVGGGPIITVRPTVPATSTTTSLESPNTTLVVTPVSIRLVASHDPFGEGGENDTLLPNLIDRNNATSWRSERYQVPLGEIKEGVGIRFNVTGVPTRVQLVGLSPGTRFEVYWAEAVLPQLSDWDRLAGAQAPPGTASLSLPPRVGGHWLIWMTDLPLQADGTYFSTLTEVRFLP
jgi:hypothetical protein